MFGLRQRQVRTRAELLREELGESFDHLRQAAAHAAEGVVAAVGPRVSAAREHLEPAAGKAAGKVRDAAGQAGETARKVRGAAGQAGEAARKVRDAAGQAGETARKVTPEYLPVIGRKKKRERARRRGMLLAVLLAIGAAIGAAGALVARRRRQQQWEEYEPARTTDPMSDVSQPVNSTSATSAGTAGSAGTATSAGTVGSAGTTVGSAGTVGAEDSTVEITPRTVDPASDPTQEVRYHTVDE